MDTYQAIDNANTPQSRASSLSPGGGSYSGGQATGAAAATADSGGSLQSRSGHFGAGVLGHGTGGASAQQMKTQYQHVLGEHYSSAGAGVLQQQENVSSNIAVGGLSEDRSSTMAGSRYVRVAQNGRSAETAALAPKFEGTT